VCGFLPRDYSPEAPLFKKVFYIPPEWGGLEPPAFWVLEPLFVGFPLSAKAYISQKGLFQNIVGLRQDGFTPSKSEA